MSAPDHRRLLAIGVVGTALAALCCFTPVLAVLLGAVGLSAALGWLDYVLLPALVFFAGLTGYALRRRSRRTGTAGRGRSPSSAPPASPSGRRTEER